MRVLGLSKHEVCVSISNLPKSADEVVKFSTLLVLDLSAVLVATT